MAMFWIFCPSCNFCWSGKYEMNGTDGDVNDANDKGFAK
jgi:hypothetical protein